MNLPPSHNFLSLPIAAMLSDTDVATKTLLYRHHRQQRYLTAMLSGPTAIIHDQLSKRPIDYTPHTWSLHDKSDNWCTCRFLAKFLLEYSHYQPDISPAKKFKCVRRLLQNLDFPLARTWCNKSHLWSACGRCKTSIM